MGLNSIQNNAIKSFTKKLLEPGFFETEEFLIEKVKELHNYILGQYSHDIIKLLQDLKIYEGQNSIILFIIESIDNEISSIAELEDWELQNIKEKSSWNLEEILENVKKIHEEQEDITDIIKENSNSILLGQFDLDNDFSVFDDEVENDYVQDEISKLETNFLEFQINPVSSKTMEYAIEMHNGNLEQFRILEEFERVKNIRECSSHSNIHLCVFELYKNVCDHLDKIYNEKAENLKQQFPTLSEFEISKINAQQQEKYHQELKNELFKLINSIKDVEDIPNLFTNYFKIIGFDISNKDYIQKTRANSKSHKVENNIFQHNKDKKSFDTIHKLKLSSTKQSHENSESEISVSNKKSRSFIIHKETEDFNSELIANHTKLICELTEDFLQESKDKKLLDFESIKNKELAETWDILLEIQQAQYEYLEKIYNEEIDNIKQNNKLDQIFLISEKDTQLQNAKIQLKESNENINIFVTRALLDHSVIDIIRIIEIYFQYYEINYSDRKIQQYEKIKLDINYSHLESSDSKSYLFLFVKFIRDQQIIFSNHVNIILGKQESILELKSKDIIISNSNEDIKEEKKEKEIPVQDTIEIKDKIIITEIHDISSTIEDLQNIHNNEQKELSARLISVPEESKDYIFESAENTGETNKDNENLQRLTEPSISFSSIEHKPIIESISSKKDIKITQKFIKTKKIPETLVCYNRLKERDGTKSKSENEIISFESGHSPIDKKDDPKTSKRKSLILKIFPTAAPTQALEKKTQDQQYQQKSTNNEIEEKSLTNSIISHRDILTISVVKSTKVKKSDKPLSMISVVTSARDKAEINKSKHNSVKKEKPLVKLVPVEKDSSTEARKKSIISRKFDKPLSMISVVSSARDKAEINKSKHNSVKKEKPLVKLLPIEKDSSTEARKKSIISRKFDKPLNMISVVTSAKDKAEMKEKSSNISIEEIMQNNVINVKQDSSTEARKKSIISRKFDKPLSMISVVTSAKDEAEINKSKHNSVKKDKPLVKLVPIEKDKSKIYKFCKSITNSKENSEFSQIYKSEAKKDKSEINRNKVNKSKHSKNNIHQSSHYISNDFFYNENEKPFRFNILILIVFALAVVISAKLGILSLAIILINIALYSAYELSKPTSINEEQNSRSFVLSNESPKDKIHVFEDTKSIKFVDLVKQKYSHIRGI